MYSSRRLCLFILTFIYLRHKRKDSNVFLSILDHRQAEYQIFHCRFLDQIFYHRFLKRGDNETRGVHGAELLPKGKMGEEVPMMQSMFDSLILKPEVGKERSTTERLSFIRFSSSSFYFFFNSVGKTKILLGKEEHRIKNQKEQKKKPKT